MNIRRKRMLTGLLGSMMILISIGLIRAVGTVKWDNIKVYPTIEDVMPDGDLYNPSTQSFLRGHHWLEDINEIEIKTDSDNHATIRFLGPDKSHWFLVTNLPIEQLVPRFHYYPASPPDEFDAYNLMLAEYSRNGLSVPFGKSGDDMAHFECNFEESVPWTLKRDYDFVPNKYFRPLRAGIINNCLKPGLWELNATDRAGEIYHAWYNMPEALYYKLISKANGVSEEFARRASQWSVKKVKLDLARLRQEETSLGEVSISLIDRPIGFSSQDSRRKLEKDFVKVEKNGKLQKPERLSDLYAFPVKMSNFIEPGKYALQDPKEFDLAFLAKPVTVEIKKVRPLTHYDWLNSSKAADRSDEAHLEFKIDLGDVKIIIGNLPMPLMVQQEDYILPGFGVGILSDNGFAERRKFLIERGPAPGYAYLVEEKGENMYGLNSHDAGIEQIFIRTHPFDKNPYWEVTITAYERIVDLVKYRIEIPQVLQEQLKQNTRVYISPIYFTYRDDNLR